MYFHMTHSGTFQVFFRNFLQRLFQIVPSQIKILFHTLVSLRFVRVLPDRPHKRVSVGRFLLIWKYLRTIENMPKGSAWNFIQNKTMFFQIKNLSKLQLEIWSPQRVLGSHRALGLHRVRQSFIKYLRLTLVLMQNSALQEKFNFCFSKALC